MTARYVFYSLLVLLLVGLLGLSWFFYSRSQNDISHTETNVTVAHHTLPVEERIIWKQLPAIIDTIYIDGTAHEVARYSETRKQDNATVAVDVSYDTRDRLFSLDMDIKTVRDSVVVEKEVIKTVIKKEKPPWVALTGGLSVGADRIDDDTRDIVAGVDLGLRFANRYTVSAFATTGRVYGIRVGIDF